MAMTHRENVKAILSYESYDRVPIVHFGYWKATLQKWVSHSDSRSIFPFRARFRTLP